MTNTGTDSDEHMTQKSDSIGTFVLVGVGAGALTGVLLGLLATRRPQAEAADARRDTVGDLKRRAEQILADLARARLGADLETPLGTSGPSER